MVGRGRLEQVLYCGPVGVPEVQNIGISLQKILEPNAQLAIVRLGEIGGLILLAKSKITFFVLRHSKRPAIKGTKVQFLERTLKPIPLPLG